MINNSFLDKLTAKWDQNKFICVGLDKGDFEFDKNIIDQTSDLVCAYKPNSAFYEETGASGLAALKKTVDYIREKDPNLPIILDAKRGDIGNTNEAYAKTIFDNLGADAVTVHPYLGKESLEPFLKRTDKGIIVLIKTSNPGGGEFQDLICQIEPTRPRLGDSIDIKGKPLYQIVAEHVKAWNTNGNLAVVVGATYPEELKKVREIIGDMPILVPGIGTQGGDLAQTLKNGLNSKNMGLIISSSRSIIFAPNPREAALQLHQNILSSIKNI